MSMGTTSCMPMVVQRRPDMATGPGRMMPPMAVSSMVMVMVAMATVPMLSMVAMVAVVAMVSMVVMVAVVAMVSMVAVVAMALMAGMEHVWPLAIKEAESGLVEGLRMDGDWQIQAPLCCL